MSTSQNMRTSGMSLGEMNQRALAERRHKKGECPTCGNKTHKIGLFGKRTALTNDGSCLYGRCLLCYPVEGYTKRPDIPGPPMMMMPGQQQIQPAVSGAVSFTPDIPVVGPNFIIEADHHDLPDDITMVSGITMDHRLIVGARNWNEQINSEELYGEEEDDDSYDDQGIGFLRRPGPSLAGDMEDMRPPERRRPSTNNSAYSADGGGGGPGFRSPAPPRRHSSNHEDAIRMMDKVGMDLTGFPAPSPSGKMHRKKIGGSFVRPPTLREERSREDRSLSGRSPTSGNSSVKEQPAEIRFEIPSRFPNERDDYKSDSVRGEEKAEITEDSFSRGRNWSQDFVANDNRSTTSDYDRDFRANLGRAPPLRRPYPDVDQAPGSSLNRERLSITNHSTGSGAISSSNINTTTNNNSRISLSPTRKNVWESPSLQSERGRESSESRNRDLAYGTGSRRGSREASGHPPLQTRRGEPDQEFSEVVPARRAPNVHKLSAAADKESSTVSIEDITMIIESLDHTNRVRGYQSLAELIMTHGQPAKLKIHQSNGISLLEESMWHNMTDASVMEAACELLFALAASSDGDPFSDMLVGDIAERAVDALIITMQTHLEIESIQQSGCGTWHCLASASSTNREVPDGTLAGAVFTVVNAMDTHRQSQEVQEWGIRALYSQCMLSTHAESNKKSLAQSGQDGGAGMGVIRQAMETANSDLVTIELACRLYWSLAANEDVARRLMETPAASSAIVSALDRYHKRPEAAPMMEAAFGALANLARICEDQFLFRDSDVIEKTIRAIQAFHYDEALYIEACALLGVLSTDRRNFELLVSLDAVNAVSKMIGRQNVELQEEALWTLVCLTNGSDEGKLALSSEASIVSFMRIMRDRKSSLSIKEMSCTLIASLCVVKDAAIIAVSNGAIDTGLALLQEYPLERKIHEAVFVAVRNITSHGTGVDVFLKFNTTRTLMDAMAASNQSETAQLNACCMIWNICAKAKKDPSSLVDGGAIAKVVSAMQTHMESGDLLEMACGALWCLIDQSDTRKKELLGCGAIDAVTCSLVMHPSEPKTLEKACGLLANICTASHMAEAIADSQGISMVVEAMSNNSAHMKLLELGALVLRNMVLTNQEFASEASNAISTIINCMKENPDAVGFQREACNALWALAAQSEECKNKILALDGVTVLMGALEHNNCVGDVQDAARGAINQLALSGQM